MNGGWRVIYVGNNDINALLFCAALLPSAPSGLCLAALDCHHCRASTLHLAFLPFAAAGQMAARTRQSGALESDHTVMDVLHKCRYQQVSQGWWKLWARLQLTWRPRRRRAGGGSDGAGTLAMSRSRCPQAPAATPSSGLQLCVRLDGQGTGACVGCSATGAA